ncbi:sensor histidine kinase [Edaphobacter modestus]|uniref:histidine kinase n=1 Tax=Edaphobacter modestus TaxID=388466 RepID=A0A4V2G4V0_9BACT|nr:ATP-binding protein [Edaphobacter modestus]RZU42366.1 heavy metal sensor kinase [Edaphobacter modestus]
MLKRQISISLRLTIWFGLMFFSGWVLFGTAMWFNLKRTLTAERRQTLARRIDRLQDLLHKNQQATDDDRFDDFRDFARATGNGLSEVFRADGSRAYPSPSSAAERFAWPLVKVGDEEQFVHVESQGQPYWTLIRPFSIDRERLFLAAAAPEAANRVLLHQFLRGLLESVPIFIVLSSVGGYWISRRALSPVDEITATARSISIHNLSDRLPVSNTGDELQRLAETCNGMLERLESAVGQIKQFTADASHELRGPLSFTRVVAEVALKRPTTDPISYRAFDDILEEVAKASVLIEDMLTLARADFESQERAFEEIDLGMIVRDACEMASPHAEAKGISFNFSIRTDQVITVLGDSLCLRRLVWILIDNAFKYTDRAGAVEVCLVQQPDCLELTVSDTGIGIAEKDLPYIFNRFFRADVSRSETEGTGLGLAIAKWISDVHHGILSVESQVAQGTIFTFTMPFLDETRE